MVPHLWTGLDTGWSSIRRISLLTYMNMELEKLHSTKHGPKWGKCKKGIHIHIKLRLARYTNLSLSKNQKFKCPQIIVVMETSASPCKRTTGLYSELVLQYSSHHTLFQKKKVKNALVKLSPPTTQRHTGWDRGARISLLISAPDGGEWATSHFGLFTPGKHHRVPIE